MTSFLRPVAFLSLFGFCHCVAAEPFRLNMEPAEPIHSQELGESILDRDLAFLIAPIKSASDIPGYLEATKHFNSPLNKLSEKRRHAFLQSLTFNDSGVSSFSFKHLRGLSISETYGILALIGQQHTIGLIDGIVEKSAIDADIAANFSAQKSCIVKSAGAKNDCSGGDHHGYYCASRASCSRRLGSICLSSC